MDRRLTRLEMFVEEARRRFDAIDARLDRLERRLEETAQQLRSEIGSATRWIIGTMIAIAVAAVTTMTFVLNNAAPARAAAPPRIPQGAADAPLAAKQPVLVVIEISGR